MVETLLQTKLYIPPARANLVSRPSLIAKLNQGLDKKLTLVSAPAGFGKTTLVSEWLSRLASESTTALESLVAAGSNHAWFSIDEIDNDIVRFFTYLVTALQQVDASLGRALLAMLQAPKLPPLQTFVGSLLNEIAALPTSLVLVLDDYHRINNPIIHDALSYFLEYQPPQMHLVVISREDPSLMLVRLRAQGQMTEIRQDDLRFSEDETALFLSAMTLPMTQENVQALRSRTEGWIAGLQLAALSMHGSQDVSGFVKSFTGSNRYILDYLMEEVFQQQSAEVQAFLLDTAILDRLTAPLCDAVTERDDGHEQLSYLEQANLFVVALDDSRQWYRYHHLFVDLLRHRRRIEKRGADVLNIRASQWYEANGYLDEAIAHSLAAPDWQRASFLINEAAEQLLRRGQMTILLRWIQALPDDVVYAQPKLCLNYAWALVLTGQPDRAEQVLEPVDQIAGGYPALQSQVVTLRAHIARARRDIPRTITLSEEALKLLPPDDDTSRGIVGLNLGLAYMYAGDLAAAGSTLETGLQAAQRSKNYQPHLVALTFLGRLRAAQGRLHNAADLYRQAIQLWEQRPSLLPIARTHVDLATILYEWNELEATEDHLRRGIELSRRSGETEIQIAGQRGLARLFQVQGDHERASEAMQAAAHLAENEGDIPPNVHLANHLAMLQLAVAQGDLVFAERIETRMVATDAGFRPVWAFLLAVTGVACPFPELAQAQLRIAQGLPAAATEQLAAVVEVANQAGLEYTLIAARLFQALTVPTSEPAVAHFTAALALAQRENYSRIFLDVGEALIPLLRRAHQQNVAPRYVMKLLAALGAAHSSPSVVSQPLVEPLSEREIEILRLLAQRRTNAEIAQVLMVSINTVKTHLRHIYEKLSVHDRRAAVIKARELKLINE